MPKRPDWARREKEVNIVSLKRRSKEEIKAILEDVGKGLSKHEISKKYGIGDKAIYHIMSEAYGEPKPKRDQNKIRKLEKELREREEEIALLKAALKKR